MNQFNEQSLNFIKRLQREAKMSKICEEQNRRNKIVYKKSPVKRCEVKLETKRGTPQ